MRKRKLLLGFVSVVLVALGGAGSSAAAQPAATEWTVWAGQSTPDLAVASNDFQPRPLEINVGDTVTWKGGGFHTVALGRDRVVPFDPASGQPNPEAAAPTGGNTFDGSGAVDSGFLQGPAEFKVTFTAPGTYTAVCDLHANMEMTLTVHPAGTPLARTPEAALAEANDHFYRVDFVGRAQPLILQEAEVTTPDGERFHEVAAGTGDGHVEILRFLPQSLVVRAGEWVTWVNSDPETPHAVTLVPGGQLPDPSGPPPDFMPPDFSPFVALGGNSYSGEEFINSGALLNDPRFQEASVGNSFSAQFANPGTYQYVCLFHAEQRMVGTVVVLPGSI